MTPAPLTPEERPTPGTTEYDRWLVSEYPTGNPAFNWHAVARSLAAVLAAVEQERDEAQEMARVNARDLDAADREVERLKAQLADWERVVALRQRADELIVYYNSLPDGVSSEAWAEAQILRRKSDDLYAALASVSGADATEEQG